MWTALNSIRMADLSASDEVPSCTILRTFECLLFAQGIT